MSRVPRVWLRRPQFRLGRQGAQGKGRGGPGGGAQEREEEGTECHLSDRAREGVASARMPGPAMKPSTRVGISGGNFIIKSMVGKCCIHTRHGLDTGRRGRISVCTLLYPKEPFVGAPIRNDEPAPGPGIIQASPTRCLFQSLADTRRAPTLYSVKRLPCRCQSSLAHQIQPPLDRKASPVDGFGFSTLSAHSSKSSIGRSARKAWLQIKARQATTVAINASIQ